MAGRPKKNPDYNKEKLFEAFLLDLQEAYEQSDSMRALAAEMGMTLLKLRKLLITAGAFSSDTSMEVNRLHEQGSSIAEIMDITGLSRASVHSYLPYVKGLYNASTLSLDADRCRIYRKRRELVDRLQKNPTEDNLWQAVIAFQNYPFKTVTGKPFRYTLKIGKNGDFNRELLIDRRENSKSLAWSSIRLAFEKGLVYNGEVKRPKNLGDIRGISYVYPLLWRFGIIKVPESASEKMKSGRYKKD